MKCVKCGSELKPGAKFCSKCGAVTGKAGQQAPGKRKPAEKRPLPTPGGNLNGGRVTPPGPGEEKKRTPTALVVTLAVLLVCLVLSIGGIAAYMMGAFDGLFSSPDSEVTQAYEDDEEDDKKDQEEEEEEESELGSGERSSEDETETEGGLSESGGLPTEAVTEPATLAETVAQPSTAAMPTLAGQGAANGLPTQAPTQGAANLPASAYQDYILPESSTRLLSASDIAGLSKEQLRIARNEIYARHGRLFTTEELQQYFNSKSWYRGTISASSFSESMLSQIEKDNIKLIQEREDALP